MRNEHRVFYGFIAALRFLCFVVLLLCIGAAGATLGHEDVRDLSYMGLRESLSASKRRGDEGDETLEAFPGTCVAWLSVEGTGISCPVARLTDAMPDGYYLSHSLWGERDASGCPYLDRRSAANGDHLMVYGHHLQGSGKMFSSLQDRYEQKSFNALGTAYWMAEDEVLAFEPLCALRVPPDYSAIQQFSFAAPDDLRAWLVALAKDADAKSDSWERQIDRTRRALTLVTCTEGNGHSKARTIVVCTNA